MSHAALSRQLSLVFHLALLAWMHVAFDRMPRQWASKRGRVSVELQASVAAAPPSAEEEIKILKAEVQKTPPPPPAKEIVELLEPAKTPVERRSTEPTPRQPTQPTETQVAKVETVEVTREPPPEPPTQTEPPTMAAKRPPLPPAPFEAVASVTSVQDDGSQFDELPHADRYNRNPPYPHEPWSRRIEGEVLLQMHVTVQGTVGGVWVLRSSGVQSFDDAAVKAAQGWRFEPGRRRGVYVAGDIKKIVRFRFPRPGEANRSML
jgi:protein TonB